MAKGLRIAGVLAAALVLVLMLRSWLRTDEERVRGLIADAESGWNDASARRTVAPLAEDFVLIPPRLNKPTLRSYLFNIYQYNRDRKTGEFLYRAAVDWEKVKVEFVDAERTHAQVSGRLTIVRTDGSDEWDYDGAFGIVAKKRDGEWRIVSAALEGLDRPRRPPRPPTPKRSG